MSERLYANLTFDELLSRADVDQGAASYLASSAGRDLIRDALEAAEDCSAACEEAYMSGQMRARQALWRIFGVRIEAAAARVEPESYRRLLNELADALREGIETQEEEKGGN